MNRAPDWKSFYGFGIEPLLELPWDDPEDAWDFVEHVRMTGSVPTDTEGSVLGTDSWQNNHRGWSYGNGWSHGDAHKFTYEEWVAEQDKPTAKERERLELIEHMRELKAQKDQARKDREDYERTMAQQRQGLESWSAWSASDAKREREANDKRVADHQRESALILQRKADEDHERRRLHIFVEQLDDGAYDVVTRKDDQPWLRHGPFEDLDYANMICREMLQRAEALRNRLVKRDGTRMASAGETSDSTMRPTIQSSAMTS